MILGRLEVRGEADEPVVLRAPKPRVLLAVLLLHASRPVNTGRLEAALWPGKPPRSAGGVLRTYVGGPSAHPPNARPDPRTTARHRNQPPPDARNAAPAPSYPPQPDRRSPRQERWRGRYRSRPSGPGIPAGRRSPRCREAADAEPPADPARPARSGRVRSGPDRRSVSFVQAPHRWRRLAAEFGRRSAWKTSSASACRPAADFERAKYPEPHDRRPPQGGPMGTRSVLPKSFEAGGPGVADPLRASIPGPRRLDEQAHGGPRQPCA
jgi:hypothetical protein